MSKFEQILSLLNMIDDFYNKEVISLVTFLGDKSGWLEIPNPQTLKKEKIYFGSLERAVEILINYLNK